MCSKGVMDERMKELNSTLCRIVVGMAKRTLSKSLGLGQDKGVQNTFVKSQKAESIILVCGEATSDRQINNKGGSVCVISHNVAPSE